MKKLIAISIAILAIGSPAFADLGDTKITSEQKFGQGKPTGNQNEFGYTSGGYFISQLYNESGVVVSADFFRLDGKPITPKMGGLMDQHNLPAWSINPQGNGWTHEKWDNQTNFKNTVNFMWSNDITWLQVVAGQSHIGNGKNWYYSRWYLVPEGVAIIKAANDESRQQQSDDVQKTSI
jgi:hypothetical protein